MPRISALIFGLSLAAGCSKSSPDTAAPDDGADAEVAADAKHDREVERAPLRVTGVYLDPALTAVCELDSREELLQYDSEAGDGHVNGMLGRVAECVKTGPLKGRRIELVGHAGARDDEYRKTYGSSRAAAIRSVLLADGLKADDIVTHAGDPEDDPDAAEQWPSERRVDVRVATRHAE